MENYQIAAIAHFTIFILFYLYLYILVNRKNKIENLNKIKFNNYVLFLITFFWEIIIMIALIIIPLKTFIKIKLYLKKQAAK